MLRLLLFTVILFSASTAQAQNIKEDETAVRIMAYYGISNDGTNPTHVTSAQFSAHLKELASGNYNVVSLPDVIRAYKDNAPMPSNSVVITFDGSDRSILKKAAPYLKKHQFPFTVLLAPKYIRDKSPRHLSIKDIKKLQRMQLVSFGIHPYSYNVNTSQDTENRTENLRAEINNAVAFYRDLFDEHPAYFSFTHGLYSQAQLNVIENYSFKALLGQQSAVAYRNETGDILPRFVMTQHYADLNRFEMTANALPFPALDISPNSSVILNNKPDIGFTTSSELGLKNLSCFASGQQKPVVEKLNNRIEIRLREPLTEPRSRVNCTLPVINENSLEKRWRWFGLLLSVE